MKFLDGLIEDVPDLSLQGRRIDVILDVSSFCLDVRFAPLLIVLVWIVIVIGVETALVWRFPSLGLPRLIASLLRPLSKSSILSV